MRAAIVGGLVMTTLAAFVFACGSDDNNSSNNNTNDAGTTTPTRPPTTTSDAGSTATFPTTYAGCGVFPRESAWNQDVSTLAVDTAATQVLADNYDNSNIGINFGKVDSGLGYIISKGAAATTQASFTLYSSTSDAERNQIDKVACPTGTTGDTCYPIPLTAKSSDGKVLLFLDTNGAPNNCTVYEVSDLTQVEADNQEVDFTSKWSLNSAALKTVQYRSTSKSGTSIFAGILKREDITKGTLTHALRVTMPADRIRNAFVSPATHSTGDTDQTGTEYFPMGTRLRLKASVAETGFTGDALIIVRGLKKYGIIVADAHGTRSGNEPITIDGESDDGWNINEDNGGLSTTLVDKIKITDFEVVNTNQAPVTQTQTN